MDVIGHRETVGRPALYATTKQFLDDLGVSSLNELPPMDSQNEPTEMLAQIEFGMGAPDATSESLVKPSADDPPDVTFPTH